jgi:bifunctional aspartokinase / homoserine dehydrogenase 1
LKDLLIMKFGGTSLGSAERIRVAGRLAAYWASRQPVALVLSAISKVTVFLKQTP